MRIFTRNGTFLYVCEAVISPQSDEKAARGILTHYSKVSAVMALINNFGGDAENHLKKS